MSSVYVVFLKKILEYVQMVPLEKYFHAKYFTESNTMYFHTKIKLS